MAYAKSIEEVADLLVTKLTNNSTLLGIQGVFYGDQNLLPATPVICVEPDVKDVSITPFRLINADISIYLIIYHSAVTSGQTNSRNADIMAQAVEDLIHADKQLLRGDGTASVIHCYIAKTAAGYVKKGTGTIRASRLTFTAKTQYQLPNT